MNIFAAEFIGTAILIALGNGVVANVVLNKTKGNSGGLIAITFGWAMAVFVAVFCATKIAGGAHLNSAITIAFAVANKTPWSEVPTYIIAQVTGAMLGSLVVYLGYRSHYDATEDGLTKRATFCTDPAIRNTLTPARRRKLFHWQDSHIWGQRPYSRLNRSCLPASLL